MLFGFETVDLAIFVGISPLICITVCTLAMEAAVLFVPAFVFLFPQMIAGFPQLNPNEAIGLAITVEFFGYTSSVLGYWFRGQVDLRLGMKVLMITVPFAIVARIAAFFIPGTGLLVVFGIVLLVLAVIIYRAYRGEVRRTCLLCGDSIAAMRMGDETEVTEPVSEEPAGQSAKPDLSHTIIFERSDGVIIATAGILGGVIGVAIGEIANTFPDDPEKGAGKDCHGHQRSGSSCHHPVGFVCQSGHHFRRGFVHKSRADRDSLAHRLHPRAGGHFRRPDRLHDQQQAG